MILERFYEEGISNTPCSVRSRNWLTLLSKALKNLLRNHHKPPTLHMELKFIVIKFCHLVFFCTEGENKQTLTENSRRKSYIFKKKIHTSLVVFHTLSYIM